MFTYWSDQTIITGLINSEWLLNILHHVFLAYELGEHQHFFYLMAMHVKLVLHLPLGQPWISHNKLRPIFLSRKTWSQAPVQNNNRHSPWLGQHHLFYYFDDDDDVAPTVCLEHCLIPNRETTMESCYQVLREATKGRVYMHKLSV